MIPSKETKELTYQLLENNFIQLQELRKSMSANTISKSFYLFYVDINQVSM
jgi:DNA-directed RNA polymerase III subunit RPC3